MTPIREDIATLHAAAMAGSAEARRERDRRLRLLLEQDRAAYQSTIRVLAEGLERTARGVR